jgi:flavin reductase (DIM6/NTAB) family NADH-FMN oxidoreductase RutF
MHDGRTTAGPDLLEFRRVLSSFCSGVVVVTAMHDATPVGLTCQSFSSLSLRPPLVMFAAGSASRSWQRVRAAQGFAVNILGAHQQDVSEAFAVSGADKFASTRWRPGEHGAPLIADALASLECRLDAVYDGGDHDIVTGLVLRLHEPDRRWSPLLFYRSQYRRLAS